MLVAVPAIRDDDPGVGADQRLELLAVAVLGDLEERRARGGQGPQRPAVTRGSPAGLIDVHRGLVKHPVVQLGVRAGERVRRALADRVDRADRETDPEQVEASSIIPRREIRLRAVNVTNAACKFGPNADPPIPAGSPAVVLAPHSRQPNRWVRCSTKITLIGGSSAT